MSWFSKIHTYGLSKFSNAILEKRVLRAHWYSRCLAASMLKVADSPYYRSRLRDTEKNKEQKELVRLFNYIKRHPQMTITMFHGTSQHVWEQIQESGYFTAPTLRNMEKAEARSEGLDEVFFTTNRDYAFYYAERSAGQHGSVPVVISLELPVYWIKEVSDVILNTEDIHYIYNEYNIQYDISNIVSDQNMNMEQKANSILDYLIDRYLDEDKKNEFTVKYAVPIRFVQETTLTDKDFLVDTLQRIKEQNTTPEAIEALVPDKFKHDDEVMKAMDAKIKDDRELYYYLEPSRIYALINNSPYAEEFYNSILELITHPDFETKIEKSFSISYDEFKYKFERAFVTTIHNTYVACNFIKNMSESTYLKSIMDYLFEDVSFLQKKLYNYTTDFALKILQDSYLGYSLVPNDAGKVTLIKDTAENYEQKFKEFTGTSDKEFGEIFQKIDRSMRESYIHFLEVIGNTDIDNLMMDNNPAITMNYQDLMDLYKNYNMPHPTQDKEAMSLIDDAARNLYLERLSTIRRDYENIIDQQNHLAELLNQPTNIEKDEQAQKKLMPVIADGIESYVTPNLRSKKAPYSYTDYEGHKSLYSEEPLETKPLFELYELPEWITSNPEHMKLVRQAYQKAISNMKDSNIDEESIHPQARYDEKGNLINYQYEAIKQRFEGDDSFLPNFHIVQQYPDLIEPYKNKLIRIMKDKGGNAFIFALFPYWLFGSNSQFHDDNVEQSALNIIRNWIESLTIKNAEDVEIIVRDVTKFEEMYYKYFDKEVYDDKNIGDILANKIISLTESYDILGGGQKMISYVHQRRSRGLTESSEGNIVGIDREVYEIEKQKLIDEMKDSEGGQPDDASDIIKAMDIHVNRMMSLKRDEELEQAMRHVAKTAIEEQSQLKELHSILKNNWFHIIHIDDEIISLIYQFILQYIDFNINKDSAHASLLILINVVYTIFNVENTEIVHGVMNNAGLNQEINKRLESIVQAIISEFQDSIVNLEKYYQDLQSGQATTGGFTYHTIEMRLSNMLEHIKYLYAALQIEQPEPVHKLISLFNRAKELENAISQLLNNQQHNAGESGMGYTVPSNSETQSSAWYKRLKMANYFGIDEAEDPEAIYNTFRDTYEQETGQSWDRDKFFQRAGNWRFYGDESGYVTVREQNSGMLKLTGVAGNLKGIYRGVQDLLQEGQPVWGMVSKNIADMAQRAGFQLADPQMVQNNINKIPSKVFGNAQIKSINSDGSVTFNYSDIGEATKYLIGNSSYFGIMQSMM